jgi:hypothetical protein
MFDETGILAMGGTVRGITLLKMKKSKIVDRVHGCPMTVHKKTVHRRRVPTITFNLERKQIR